MYLCMYYYSTHWGGSTRVLGWTLGRLLAEAPIWLADRFSDCWFNKLEAKPAWYCSYTEVHKENHSEIHQDIQTSTCRSTQRYKKKDTQNTRTHTKYYIQKYTKKYSVCISWTSSATTSGKAAMLKAETHFRFFNNLAVVGLATDRSVSGSGSRPQPIYFWGW